MDKMYPQSELDNYKLQVELLQEKLQRSEENRHQLEHKLEHILQKRSEHDKMVRSKSRQKYQQFLDEQQKRNERNKLLVQMLERIDEQSAALSSRSERLKMMKLQYEMYFAKLVQTQTMRCIQNNAMAATSIPVLLPTPAATSTPIKHAEQVTATQSHPPTIFQIDNNTLPTTYSSNMHNISGNSNFIETPHQWMLALATQTPAGMMLTNRPTAAGATATMPDMDYLKYPIGYMSTPLHFAYQQPAAADAPHMLPTNRGNSDGARQPAPLDTIADINESIVGVGKQTPKQSCSTAYGRSINNNINADADEHSEAMKSSEDAAAVATMLSPYPTTATPTPKLISAPIPSSSTTMTAASTSLTFDKLSTHNGKSKMLPQNGVNVAATEAPAGVEQAAVTEFVDFNSGTAAALPNPRNFASANAPSSSSNNNNNNYNNVNSEKVAAVNDAYEADNANLRRRQKIDDAWETTTPTIEVARQSGLSAAITTTIPTPTPTPTTVIGKDIDSSSNAFAGDKRIEPKNNGYSFDSELAAAATKRPQEMPATTTTTAVTDSYQPPHFERKEKMSIENIENTFYGELVNPVATDALPPPESNKQAALTVTNGLLEELASSNPTAESIMQAATSKADESNAVHESNEAAQADYEYGGLADADYAENANSGYAPAAESSGDAYASETDAQQYQQYAEQQAAGQGYDPNLDYQNYDAAAYQAAYDPNAYPGYTYDEATGQYTANDDNQQYTESAASYGEAAYTQQDYDAAQQQQQQQQQEEIAANYDFNQYMSNEVVAAAAAAEPTPENSEQPQELEIPQQESAKLVRQASVEADQLNVEATPKTAPTKPTSILATEKSAANDAYQKRKKRVNFVDSSETDDSSSVKPDGAAGVVGGGVVAGGGSSESDFDFSSSGGVANN